MFGAAQIRPLPLTVRDSSVTLATVLVAMEREGVSIDADGIKAFGKQVCEKAEKISREIYEYLIFVLTIGSWQRMMNILIGLIH